MPDAVKISDQEREYLLQMREAAMKRREADAIAIRAIEKRLGMGGTREERRDAARGVERAR